MGNAKKARGIMFQCERLFGETRGQQIQALVEEATGELCPCKAGRSCPLGEAEERPQLRLISCA